MNDKRKIVLLIGIATAIVICGSFIGYQFLIRNNEEIIDKEQNESLEESIEAIEVNPSITLELGSTLPRVEDFFKGNYRNAKIVIYNGDNEVRSLDKVGEYPVVITIDKKEYTSKIIVVDKVGPVLTLKDVTIKTGDKYDVSSFLTSCEDNSGEPCVLSFSKENMSSYTKKGTYDIEVIAKDASGNVSSKTAKLVIEEKKSSNSNNNTNHSNNNNSNSNNNSNNSNNSNNNSNNNSSSNNNNNNNSNTNQNTQTPPSSSGNNETTTEPEETKIKTTAELESEASTLASTHSGKINEVLSNVNAYRSAVGVAPITLDSSLTLAASVRALEMGLYNAYKADHTRPDGSICFTVLNDLGISYRTAGENIAKGYTSAGAVSEGWKNSQGHYENMINSSFTKIGIGVAYVNGSYYWVQMFTG